MPYHGRGSKVSFIPPDIGFTVKLKIKEVRNIKALRQALKISEEGLASSAQPKRQGCYKPRAGVTQCLISNYQGG